MMNNNNVYCVNFKVGDRVIICVDSNHEYRLGLVDDMIRYNGVETYITSITPYGNYNIRYDKGRFCWDDTMLKPANVEYETATQDELEEFLNG